MGFQGNYQGKFQGNYDGALVSIEDVSSSFDLTSSGSESLIYTESDSNSFDLTSSSTSISELVELLSSALDATSSFGDIDSGTTSLDLASSSSEMIAFVESDSSALDLTSTPTENVDYIESDSNALDLVSSIQTDQPNVIDENVSSALDLVDTSAVFVEMPESPTSAFDATTSDSDLAVFNDSDSDAFDLASAIVDVLIYVISNNLDLASAIADVANFIESRSSDFSLTQTIVAAIELSFNTLFTLTSDAVVTWPETGESDLSLIDSWTDDQSIGVSSTLDLTSASADQAIYSDSVSSALDLTQQVSATRVSRGIGCEAEYGAPLNPRDTVEFAWDVLLVRIRPPEFGNSMSLDTTALIRRNRGGEYRTSRPTTWPTVRVQKLHFTTLTATERADLISFLSQSSGREITYLDQESTQWTGVILNNEIDFVKGKSACSNEIELEFRGVRS